MTNQNLGFSDEEIINHIRRLPTMYFSSKNERGVEHFVYELVGNVLDLFLTKQATFVNVQIDGSRILVADDGNGLPFDEPSEIDGVSLATKFLTCIHHTPSHDQHFPHVHMTLRGVGLTPLNAASTKLNVRSWRSGQLWEQNFSRGYAQSSAIVVENGSGRGTTIEIIPDPEIFGQAQPRTWVIRKALFEIAHLFAGFKIGFNQEHLCSPEGLHMLGHMLTFKQYSDAFHIALRIEDIFIEVAAFGEQISYTDILSWVNGAKTYEYGSHVEGFLQILDEVGWKPSLILIHVVMYNPEYAGPMKTRLNAPDIKEIIQNALREPLRQHRTSG